MIIEIADLIVSVLRLIAAGLVLIGSMTLLMWAVMWFQQLLFARWVFPVRKLLKKRFGLALALNEIDLCRRYVIYTVLAPAGDVAELMPEIKQVLQRDALLIVAGYDDGLPRLKIWRAAVS